MAEKVYALYWFQKDQRLLLLFNLKDGEDQRRSLQGYFQDLAAAREFLAFLGLSRDVNIKEVD